MAWHPNLAIFDLDGTLIDPQAESYFAQAEEVLAKLGYPHVTREDYAHSIRAHKPWFFIPEELRKDFARQFWHLYDEERDPPPQAIEGAIEALEYCVSAGSKVAIATARTEIQESIRAGLEKIGLLKHICQVSLRDLNDHTWTNKRGQILDLCKTFNAAPHETLMVGDSPVDIESGKAAALKLTVAVLSGGLHEEVLKSHGPDLIIPDLAHLPGALKKLPDEG